MSDKKYYWLKLKRDFFKRHDIRIVEEMPNGKEYILFYLKLLCESVDHEGNLRFSDEIPYNESMLATITNTNLDIVRSAVKIFTDLHMMEVLDDGTLFMRDVDRMMGSAADTDSANRQRRYRERLKLLENNENVTDALHERNASVTKRNESKSIEIDIDKEIDIEKENTKKKKSASRFQKPTLEEVTEYINENMFIVKPEVFYDYYESNGWYVGKKKMSDWKATLRNWDRKEQERKQTQKKGQSVF